MTCVLVSFAQNYVLVGALFRQIVMIKPLCIKSLEMPEKEINQFIVIMT